MARPKKNAPAELSAANVEEAVKKTARKTTARKAPAKMVEEIYLQAGGAEWNVAECKERVVAAYVESGHRASSVKKLVIYLKPEEGKAYYVVNDDVNGSVDL